MKISLKWLNDFVDISEYFNKPQLLADILTKAGLEVEGIQNRASDYASVVVGHIVSKEKHPNADKLSLCQVEIADKQIVQIVCGAQNHKAGDKVIAALAGALLPGNFVIKKSKIRDIESHGMLCSYKELGLADSADGIAILDSVAKTGLSFAEFAGFDDVCFELKLTPNRADCLSHYGLAREIGCLLNKPVNKPEILTKFSVSSTKQKVKLEIADEVLNKELCPRYCGRYISGVKIGSSPDWLKKRLEAVGQNSINNVVDVTNYVMLEMGQPLHAFDADLIAGSTVIVRKAYKQEKFKTLKEQELILSGDELVICDAQKPVALAGVIGGINTGVTESTQNIFLESASFNAMSVRKSSRRHGVETDSAYRFSRGVDASSSSLIMDRAALLIQQVAGGDVFTEAYDLTYDFNSGVQIQKAIQISIKTISDRLGYLADEILFLNYMQGLQIKVEKLSEGEYLMTPPLFRFDLECDMDLVEEYARLQGYEYIQENIPALKTPPTSHDAIYMMTQKISGFIRSEGFNQAFNYAFTSDELENSWIADLTVLRNQGLLTDDVAIKIKNPLSKDLNVMRRTLSLGLWRNAVDNIHAGNQEGGLFEIGSVFSSVFLKNELEYCEPKRLALVAWGEASLVNSGLYTNSIPPVFNIKSAIEKLFGMLQISAYSFVSGGKAPAFLHLGQCVQVMVQGQAVGFIGSVHPRQLDNEKVRVPVALAELNLEQILKGQPKAIKFKPLSKFQSAQRDFAFIIESQKNIGDLLKEAKKTCGVNLKELTVFDIYEGDKLPVGQKSVAVRAHFQATTDIALTEADFLQLSQKLVEAAKKSINAVLR